MNLTKEEVDEIIKRHYRTPNRDDYILVSNWYEEYKNFFFDQNYIICVYLFLLGANIKNSYIPFTRQQNKDWITEIKQIIDNADSLQRLQRKTYLDYGTKSF